ncbi:MAG: ribosomal protein S18-alanine N-acetyltransferase [Eubacteriales bacterium]|nr:ribosomal protein S18-alanine N-acetyltransferase [Eubacteriales bacterium]
MHTDVYLSLDNFDFVDQIDELDRSIFETEGWGREDFIKNMKNSYDNVLLLLSEKGEAIAYAVIRNLGIAEILRIGVSPKYRRNGYASLIMNKIIDISKKNNAESLLLEVRSGNEAAIGLYRHFGFKEIDVRKKYYSKPVEDALIMELVLERNC